MDGGLVDVTQPSHSADGDGKADDTEAIQRAKDGADVRQRRVVGLRDHRRVMLQQQPVHGAAERDARWRGEEAEPRGRTRSAGGSVLPLYVGHPETD